MEAGMDKGGEAGMQVEKEVDVPECCGDGEAGEGLRKEELSLGLDWARAVFEGEEGRAVRGGQTDGGAGGEYHRGLIELSGKMSILMAILNAA
eukprot:398691-Rhodomonas_salina.1